MACRVRLTHPQRQRQRRKSVRENLSERLYAWRKRNDYSQSEAALKLQVSVRTLQEWEQGRALPHGLTLRTLHQLTRA
jgi:DNA-binding transcriptional regulator YiaG